MRTQTNLATRKEVTDSLGSSAFIAAFIAALVVNGRTAIKPKTAHDQSSFYRVYELIEEEVRRLRQNMASSPATYREMVRLRNSIQPSSSGAFDGFEHLLRDQQLWLTACANPFYEEISFEITEPYARSILERANESTRTLAEIAASKFLDDK